jgi:hypothetical protein
MADLKAYLASKSAFDLVNTRKADVRYMSGPKADAILARSTDPTIKKRRKKVKNEDYPTASGSGTSGKENGGLMFRDEDDEWRRRIGDDMDIDGDDAPGECSPLTHKPTEERDSRAYNSCGQGYRNVQDLKVAVEHGSWRVIYTTEGCRYRSKSRT